MSFFTLSSDIILIILEELDPLSLFHFCLASRAIHAIVTRSTTLRYHHELALCGMRDGPPGSYSPRTRLLSLLGYKRGWPTLSPSAEDRLFITPPTIMGVSGNYLFHASQSPLNNGYEWVLHVYQLRSFRMAPQSRLPYYQHNVPFEIRKVAIDASQELMILAQLFFPPQQQVVLIANSAITVMLHIRNLYICQDHPRAAQPRLSFQTDWWGDFPPGQRLSIEQVRICGSLVAASIRLELETGEGTTELVVFNWCRGGSPVRTLTGDLLSFDFIDESRLIVASHPDDDGSDDSTTWERRSDGLYANEKGKRPPQIAIQEIYKAHDHDFPSSRSYEFAEAWSGVSFVQLCPNHSSNISPLPGTLFDSSTSCRSTAVLLEFQPHATPSGCSRKIIVVFDQSRLPLRGERFDTMRWEDWQHHCMVLNLPDRADAVQLCGRRLTFFENLKDAQDVATAIDATSRVHVLDLNPRTASFLWSLSRTDPPWRWRDSLTALSTVFVHRGSRYVRTSTVDAINMTWMNTTEDSLVLYDVRLHSRSSSLLSKLGFKEREGQCHIRILTFGKEVRESA
ncbi:hypothetical protein L210DRAFT_3640545 [Boletus edulis BED1]|uniref:F-box domain-containing protein n=1 Tax=Boletus edulis BED1 TaxID=1328754 RepID=A0AAD4C4G3_BOLED|nr:hypothetical protein L210DRAFT_3640545 [Boletus edulis BED1]